MKITAWRIFKTKPAAQPFDGEGARRFGGRWNSKGNRMVYTAGHYSLAVLEILVNLDRSSILPSYLVSSVHFDDALVERLDRSRLPANWRHSPAPPELQRIGDEWLASRSSVVLEVPSVVMEIENNYLINPQHLDSSLISIDPPQPFTFDSRLLD
ncbi:MAG: RES domain-containing protein [Pyrinomonadaceae bacterium]|nr:RES domain-containing protein [Pyrinomonadaceae bacterium]